MGSSGHKFLALLRGINVGGKNVIKKDALRQAFEEMGYTSVRTYIQSGNILFRSINDDVSEHTRTMEAFLSDRFSYGARALILSETQYQSILENAPENWGKDADFRHRILFVLGGLEAEEIYQTFGEQNNEIETITTGEGVIYSSVSKQHLTKSVMRKLASTPEYQHLTIRNHNTVFKLGTLFDEI